MNNHTGAQDYNVLEGETGIVEGSYDFELTSACNTYKILTMKFNLEARNGNKDLPVQASKRATQVT